MIQYLFDARVIQDHFPGIGRYAYNLLAALPDRLQDDEALVVLRDPGTRNSHYRLQALASPKISWIEHQVPIFSAPNALAAPRIPGVAVAHYPYYVRPYLARTPSVTTLYDAISLVYPRLVPSAGTRFMIRLLTELAIRASRHILTISQSAAQDIARYYPAARGKISVTPLAAEPMFSPQSAERCEAVRAKYDLPERFALYLASNKPHKNLVRLVEAWKLAANANLVIAGHQDQRYPQAQARAGELGIAGQIRFIGAVSNADMPALYSACDLFVFPSLYEGFGLTPLEAMACGAPVACSNASSLPEVVGDAALLFDPTDVGQIAEACRQALADHGLRAALRERGLRQAARFSWDDAAQATVEVYRAAAKRR